MGIAKKEIDIAKIKNIQPSRITPFRKKIFPKDVVKESTAQYLTSVLTLFQKEEEYLENFSKGIYKPDLLFSDLGRYEK